MCRYLTVIYRYVFTLRDIMNTAYIRVMVVGDIFRADGMSLLTRRIRMMLDWFHTNGYLDWIANTQDDGNDTIRYTVRVRTNPQVQIIFDLHDTDTYMSAKEQASIVIVGIKHKSLGESYSILDYTTANHPDRLICLASLNEADTDNITEVFNTFNQYKIQHVFLYTRSRQQSDFSLPLHYACQIALNLSSIPQVHMTSIGCNRQRRTGYSGDDTYYEDDRRGRGGENRGRGRGGRGRGREIHRDKDGHRIYY